MDFDKPLTQLTTQAKHVFGYVDESDDRKSGHKEARESGRSRPDERIRAIGGVERVRTRGREIPHQGTEDGSAPGH